MIWLCDLTTCDVHVLNWVQAEMIDMQGKKGRSGWHLLRRDMVGMLEIKGDVLNRMNQSIHTYEKGG